MLYIQEVAPWFGVPGEAFHEGRVAVSACMGASDVRVGGEVPDRQVRLRHDALRVHMPDDRSGHVLLPARNDLCVPWATVSSGLRCPRMIGDEGSCSGMFALTLSGLLLA